MFFRRLKMAKYILWKFRISGRTEPNYRTETLPNQNEPNPNVRTLIHINDCSVRVRSNPSANSTVD